MYAKYCTLRDAKGVKDADVAKGTGINKSTFADWKSGRSVPKYEKLAKIAAYFGVPVSYFEGSEPSEMPYYLNDDAKEAAEFLFHHPDHKVLFDAVRGVRSEDVEFICEMIKRASR